HKCIQFHRLAIWLCKSYRTSFGFCRGLLQTNRCPFLHIRLSLAESKTFATKHAALTPVSCSVVPQGSVSNVDMDGKNTLQIKAISVVISTFETLPVRVLHLAANGAGYRPAAGRRAGDLSGPHRSLSA